MRKSYRRTSIPDRHAFTGLCFILLTGVIACNSSLTGEEKKEIPFPEAYTGTLAQGGFLVSAEQKSGETVWVRIKASIDGQVKLLDPFKGKDPDWNRDDVERKGEELSVMHYGKE